MLLLKLKIMQSSHSVLLIIQTATGIKHGELYIYLQIIKEEEIAVNKVSKAKLLFGVRSSITNFR